METAVDAIIVIDEAGTVQSLNPSTTRIFGYPSDELVGRNVSLLMPADQAAQHDTFIDNYRRTGHRKIIGVGRSVVGRRRDGSLFPIELSIAEWTAEDGRRFFTGVLRDLADYRAAEAALKESQDWLQTVSDAAGAGLAVIDEDHCVRFASRAYGTLLDLTSHVLVGRHMRDILPGLYDTVVRDRLEAAFAGARNSYVTVLAARDGSGRTKTLSESYEPSLSATGRPVAVVVLTDVTELKNKEIALRSNIDLLQSVLDGTTDAIFAKDGNGRYVVVNESGARIIGRGREEIIGRNDEDLLGAESARAILQHDRDVRQSGRPMVAEQSLSIDGQVRHFVVSKRPWGGPEGHPGGVVGISRDVTEQHMIATERAELAKRLMRAQEQERLRIARELHDQVGQDLTGLALGLKSLEGDLGRDERASRLAWLRTLTDQISRNLHRTARELRPTSLEDLGLREAIVSYASEISANLGVQVEVVIDGADLPTLGSETELILYRCIQEAMTNVLKHANATYVSILAQQLPLELRVIVEDNGSGFIPEFARLVGQDCGLGLLGMRERLDQIGGSLAIESSPGGGTSVFMSVPIAPGSKDAQSEDKTSRR